MPTGCTGSRSYTLTVALDPVVQQSKLVADDGVAFDFLGASAALSAEGRTAVLGATGGATGAVYVFTRSGATWTQEAKLVPAGATANDGFGAWVSISADGNTVFAGALAVTINDQANQGAAYVFTRSGTTWSQQAMLTASEGAPNDFFGVWGAISPDGNTVIAGASQSNFNFSADLDPDAGPGAAYVFTRSGTSWSQQAKLTGSDVGSGEEFGWTVALGADTAVIVANLADGSQLHQGAAYVFTRVGRPGQSRRS